MQFYEKLRNIQLKNNSLLCIGLDSDFDHIPSFVKKENDPQFSFNKAIIDETYNLVSAYKPNSAFYEALGNKGVAQLKMTCDYIHSHYPDIPIILDAKRGDIGNTNKGYASFAFEFLKADAVTVMPYMGIESLKAFFAYKDRGIIVGCHSSNPGGKEFQDLVFEGIPLYKIVAKNLMKQYGDNPNTMIFMGATYPEQIKEIREIVNDMTLLIPGLGSQGGDTEKTIKAGLNADKAGLILNASRSIIFSSDTIDYAKMAKKEALGLHKIINNYR